MSVVRIVTQPKPEVDSDTTARKQKTLNLNTYKFHSLGDVVPTIRRFGTTDSYSTQIVRTSLFSFTLRGPDLLPRTAGTLASISEGALQAHEQEECQQAALQDPNATGPHSETTEAAAA